jgi:hypothetical protein
VLNHFLFCLGSKLEQQIDGWLAKAQQKRHGTASSAVRAMIAP